MKIQRVRCHNKEVTSTQVITLSHVKVRICNNLLVLEDPPILSGGGSLQTISVSSI